MREKKNCLVNEIFVDQYFNSEIKSKIRKLLTFRYPLHFNLIDLSELFKILNSSDFPMSFFCKGILLKIIRFATDFKSNKYQNF